MKCVCGVQWICRAAPAKCPGSTVRIAAHHEMKRSGQFLGHTSHIARAPEPWWWMVAAQSREPSSSGTQKNTRGADGREGFIEPFPGRATLHGCPSFTHSFTGSFVPLLSEWMCCAKWCIRHWGQSRKHNPCPSTLPHRSGHKRQEMLQGDACCRHTGSGRESDSRLSYPASQ